MTDTKKPTGTDVAVRAKGDPEIPDKRESGPRRAPRSMAIIPRTIPEIMEIADLLVSSGMAPKALSRRDQIAVALMHGAELGLPPMASVQSIALINGRPSIWGDAMLGLCQGSGLLEYMEEGFEAAKDPEEGWTAYCIVKRYGYPKAIRQTYSVARAKKAQLWAKSGPWQTDPKRMLQVRARAFALRDAFSDVLRGLHSAEEVLDYEQTKRESNIIDVEIEDFEPTPVNKPKNDGPSREDLIEEAALDADEGESNDAENFAHEDSQDADDDGDFILDQIEAIPATEDAINLWLHKNDAVLEDVKNDDLDRHAVLMDAIDKKMGDATAAELKKSQSPDRRARGIVN